MNFRWSLHSKNCEAWKLTQNLCSNSACEEDSTRSEIKATKIAEEMAAQASDKRTFCGVKRFGVQMIPVLAVRGCSSNLT